MSRVIEARDAFFNECSDENGGALFRTVMRLFMKLMPKERIVEHVRNVMGAVYDERIAPNYPMDNQGRRIVAHLAGETVDALLQDL